MKAADGEGLTLRHAALTAASAYLLPPGYHR